MRDSSARQLRPRPQQDAVPNRGDRIRQEYNVSRAGLRQNGKKLRQPKKHPTYNRVMKGSKSMPSIFRRGNIFFIVENERSHYRFPRNLLISVAVVVICSIGIVLTHAQIAGIERQITISRNRLNAIIEQNRTAELDIGGHHTLEEIEYIAIMHLGMAPPDASQIIEINVPAQSHVEFNRNIDVLPRENYFWTDMRNFINGILDRVFG